MKRFLAFCVDRPLVVTAVMLVLAALLGLLAGLPTVYPQRFASLHPAEIDTDPENMLPEDDPVRVYHNRMRQTLNLHDMVVLGVVNREHPEGVFNPETLEKIHAVTEHAGTLRWKKQKQTSNLARILKAVMGVRPETVSEAHARPQTGGTPPDAPPEDAPGSPALPGGIGGEGSDGGPALPGGMGGEARTEAPPADQAADSPEPPQEPEYEGVIEREIIAPSTVDKIEQGGLGSIDFSWLMAKPPETRDGALTVRREAMGQPFLRGTLVSDQGENRGKAIAIYIPLTSKDLSYRVSTALQEKIASLPDGPEEWHITGLPVAEDTFGVQMFKQMAISAPMAMLIIFVLMWVFFRKVSLIVPPMIVAVVCVVLTMGLLVVTGNTIHIMSSMIPIFIMPIAVLDAVHILSEFFDRYQETKDRRTTILNVMHTLFWPMLYTSLTTAVGFASLALTPIPPVQVFGVFVAFGVLMAWFWTITFIPASVMFIPAKWLEGFGLAAGEEEAQEGKGALPAVGRTMVRHARVVIAVVVVLMAVAFWGISQIRINDNPVKWFEPSHPIRVADEVLNNYFGGTYMAYLALEPESPAPPADEALGDFLDASEARQQELADADVAGTAEVFQDLRKKARSVSREGMPLVRFLNELEDYAATRQADATDRYTAWEEATLFVSARKQQNEIFKQPEALRYLQQVQDELQATGIVGKSNSLADLVKTLHREIRGGREEHFTIPPRADTIGQLLTVTFQNSHRATDLWHFTTPEDPQGGTIGFRNTSVWVQLKSGDNRDMEKVEEAIAAFVEENPPPMGLTTRWFGKTYLNVVWQEKMVSGMLNAFLGSFLVVLLMMILLFRSGLWGLLSMVPLTITIASIYGIIGLVGKDYDMPVAVLSSLSLGLAVDYAIHFLARSRAISERHGGWRAAVNAVFGEPARAISRNVLVVGVGFLPLLAAPLVPYQTVGIFIAAILVCAGVATLLVLPAVITLLSRFLFPEQEQTRLACKCGTCILTAVVGVALIVTNAYQFVEMPVTGWTLFTIGAVVGLMLLCNWSSRRKTCGLPRKGEETES
jgi:hypothetical protein